MKNILITGGTGYIGSHTCVALLKIGFNLTIIDSNINSSSKSINRIKKILEKDYLDKKVLFFKGDIRDKKFLDAIFFNAIKQNDPIQGVIHFAGLKAVSESLFKPLLYWENNVYGSLELLVSILPNGELDEIKLIESSGHLVLDKAAISIVKMASPFAPFPEEMSQSIDLLEVIRIWDFRKNASQRFKFNARN